MTSFLKNKPKLSLQVPSDDEYSMDLGETTNETYTTLSPLEIDSSSDDDSVVDVINPDFKKLLNHTVNVENINNFGQQIENKKIKRTYARSLKKNDMLKGKGLPVTLNYFLNSDINPPIFTKVFLLCSVIFTFLNLISCFLRKLCQIPIFFLDKKYQGNFSPGSFFLPGEISECPKIKLDLILYFFFKKLLNLKIEFICFCENFLYL